MAKRTKTAVAVINRDADVDDLFDFGDNPELQAEIQVALAEMKPSELPVAGMGEANANAPKEVKGIQLLRVPVGLIRPNPYQYRQEITPESVADLVTQFTAQGIDNALEQFPKATTRTDSSNGQVYYVLISGHRRWTAWQLAFPGEPIPLAIKPGLSEQDLIFGSLAENLTRQAASEVEYGRALKTWLDKDPKMSLVKLSEMFKKSRSTLSNLIRLTILPFSLQEENRLGRLSVQMGMVLVRFEEAGLKGAAEYGYQAAQERKLTAEEVERAGWRLLADWPGWEVYPMPPEAAEVLVPKISVYGRPVSVPTDQTQPTGSSALDDTWEATTHHQLQPVATTASTDNGSSNDLTSVEAGYFQPTTVLAPPISTTAVVAKEPGLVAAVMSQPPTFGDASETTVAPAPASFGATIVPNPQETELELAALNSASAPTAPVQATTLSAPIVSTETVTISSSNDSSGPSNLVGASGSGNEKNGYTSEPVREREMQVAAVPPTHMAHMAHMATGGSIKAPAEVVEELLMRLRRLQKNQAHPGIGISGVGAVATFNPASLPEDMLVSFQLSFALALGSVDQDVIGKVLGTRWHWLTGGKRGNNPTLVDLENAWEWTIYLDPPMLALLSAELWVEQRRWEEKNLNVQARNQLTGLAQHLQAQAQQTQAGVGLGETKRAG